MMRVVFVAGYMHPVYHRKIELLADEPDLDLLHVTVTGYGRVPGLYPSANGRRQYRVQAYGAHYLGRQGDPHRGFLWPPHYALRGFQPDIIHAESDLETLGTAQVSMARWLWARRGKLVHYSWQNILRPRSWMVRLVTGVSLHAADHLICASCEAVDVLRQQGYHGSASVLPLVGLDTRLFRPQPVTELRANLNLCGFVVGYVGRLVPEKGIDVLLRAVAQAAQPVQVIIIGDGPEKAYLAAMAHSLAIADRCRFVGDVPYDDVPAYLNVFDVLALPSRTQTHWKEQFGRVLVEAMGCRVAVIGSDSGAIPEVIGDAGFVFPEGDATALAGLLDRLAAEPRELAAARERGYERALSTYAVERIAAQTLIIWKDLLR